MSALPWFALWSDFSDHPKTIRLCARLGDPNAGMYVVRLLSYCARYAQDGRIPKDMLNHAACWKRRSSLSQVLLECGFIESEDDQWIVHGWTERNGAHVRKHAKDNEKPSASRRNPDKTPRGVSAGPPAGEERRGEDKKNGSDAEKPASLFPAESDHREAPLESPRAGPAQGAGGDQQAKNEPPRSVHVRPPVPATTRHAALTASLVAVFAEVRGGRYLHSGAKDAAAVKRLMTACPDDAEIARRWRASLVEQGFHRCDSLAQLATPERFNHFARAAAQVTKLRRLGAPDSANA